MSRPFLTLVVCSADRARHDRCIAHYRQRLAGCDHEIVAIHDASSLASAYNWAARHARGELVVFSHDDVEIASEGLADALRRATESLDVVGVAGTSRVVDAYWPRAGHPWLHGFVAAPCPDGYTVSVYGVDGAVTAGLEALDGLFLAATRDVLRRVPFDEATFDGFHGYDVDFTFRAHRAGFRVGTCAEIAAVHASQGGYGEAWTRYAARFAAKHRDALAGRAAARSWPVAAIKVATKEEVARAFPVATLKAITAKLRPPAGGRG
jgi:GT2 family glycosyltransferase